MQNENLTKLLVTNFFFLNNKSNKSFNTHNVLDLNPKACATAHHGCEQFTNQSERIETLVIW